jgi:hypothetical protein
MGEQRLRRGDQFGEWSKRVLKGKEPDFGRSRNVREDAGFFSGIVLGLPMLLIDLLFGGWRRRRRGP